MKHRNSIIALLLAIVMAFSSITFIPDSVSAASVNKPVVLTNTITDATTSIQVIGYTGTTLYIKNGSKTVKKQKFTADAVKTIKIAAQKAGTKLKFYLQSGKTKSATVSIKVKALSSQKQNKSVKKPSVATKTIKSTTTKIKIKGYKGTTVKIVNDKKKVVKSVKFTKNATKTVTIAKQASGTLYFYSVKGKNRSTVVQKAIKDVTKPSDPAVTVKSESSISVKGEKGALVYVNGSNKGILTATSAQTFTGVDFDTNGYYSVYLKDAVGNKSTTVKTKSPYYTEPKKPEETEPTQPEFTVTGGGNITKTVGDSFSVSFTASSSVSLSEVTWSIGSTAIASFTDKNATSASLKANKAGSTTIKATVKGKSVQWNLTVEEKETQAQPTEPTFSISGSSSITTIATDSFTVNVTANTFSGVKLSDISWSVGDASILHITSEAVKSATIKALKAGTTTVKMTYKTQTLTWNVTVNEIPDTLNIAIIGDQYIVAATGSSFTVKLKCYKDPLSDSDTVWTSSDSNVLTISSHNATSATITVKDKGTAKIMATAKGDTLTWTVFSPSDVYDESLFASYSPTPLISGKDNSGYSYEVYLMNNPNFPLYAVSTKGYEYGSYGVFYIKTDNPNKSTISFSGDDGADASSSGNKFVDVTYDKSIELYFTKVAGGYLHYRVWRTAGIKTIQFTANGKAIGNTTLTVKDPDAAYDAWLDARIAELTEGLTTEKEKMNALRDYVKKCFRYETMNSGGTIIHLTTHVGAYWEVKEINCTGSTGLMKDFAAKLGLTSERMYKSDSSHTWNKITYSDGTSEELDAQPAPSNTITSWDMVIK